MKKYLFLLIISLSFSALPNLGYGQEKSKGKKGKCCKGKSTVNCIQVDALHCCDGNTVVPKCIPENSTLAIKVLHVNPFKTFISSSASTKLIDFGNDSLFSFAFKADTKHDSINKGKANLNDPLKINPELISNCETKIFDALNQLTLLNRAEKQLQKLFDTTFITKTVFTKRMWSILECIGISNNCECKIKTDSCCNCAAHLKYQDLYKNLNEGYDCIKNLYTPGEGKNAGDFSLSGKLKDEGKGVTVEIKNAKGTYEVKDEDKMRPYFDNLTNIVKKANSDSVKHALLLSAEYIDDCISKLCNYPESEFSQQNYIKEPVVGDFITVTPFLKKWNGDTIKLVDFPVQKIRICGGHRANVSSGISFSFMGMNDDDFSITQASTDSLFIIKRTDKGASLYIPSLTTFLHFYTRNCRYLQNAATLGLSVNPTSLESLKVMAGYSLIFGEERRLVFSIGAVAGAVNRLKTKYEKDKELYKKDYPNLQESELTAKRFRVGMFIGLSYNLSKLR